MGAEKGREGEEKGEGRGRGGKGRKRRGREWSGPPCVSY